MRSRCRRRGTRPRASGWYFFLGTQERAQGRGCIPRRQRTSGRRYSSERRGVEVTCQVARSAPPVLDLRRARVPIHHPSDEATAQYRRASRDKAKDGRRQQRLRKDRDKEQERSELPPTSAPARRRMLRSETPERLPVDPDRCRRCCGGGRAGRGRIGIRRCGGELFERDPGWLLPGGGDLGVLCHR